MPFTGPGNPRKIYKLPKARGLTRPHSFRNEWTPRTPDRLVADLRSAGHDVPTEEVRFFLDDCVQRRLAISEQGRYLTVALPYRSGRYA
jgi:hypothetical protein